MIKNFVIDTIKEIIVYLLSFVKYALKASWSSCVHPLGGSRTHLYCITPTKSWRPISAKTHRKKVVSIRTSDSILMDFNSVLTMAFKPGISKRNTDFNLSKKRYLPDQNKKGVYLRNVSLFTAFMAFKHSNISLTIFYDELIVTSYYQRFRFISDNFLTSFY